jgi:hypothetical protein
MPALADLAVEAMAWLGAYAANVVSSPQQLIAHAAALVGVILAACAALMRTMVPLRWMAVGSNLGLLVFGLLKPSPVTGIVAGLLLPINIYRALEIMRLSRRVEKAAKGSDMATIWLRPYMKPRRLRAGTVLFRKGDRANRLYLLTDGELEVVEHGQRIEPGRVFGEIALFSPDHLRTGTVKALTSSRVLWIHESTVRQLYFQNPTFGFHLVELLASRLSTDVGRSEQKLAQVLEATGSGTRPLPDMPRPDWAVPAPPAAAAPSTPPATPPG